jgi:hypothetical protein
MRKPFTPAFNCPEAPGLWFMKIGRFVEAGARFRPPELRGPVVRFLFVGRTPEECFRRYEAYSGLEFSPERVERCLASTRLFGHVLVNFDLDS